MTNYINTIGQLTQDEMPKAPTNFAMQIVTGETETTINLSWTPNMTKTQFPGDEFGQYYLAIQEWVYGATEWSDAEGFLDLESNSWSVTKELKTRAIRYRVVVEYYEEALGDISQWYPSQPLIAYFNRIQPLAVSGVEVDTTQGQNGWYVLSGTPNSSNTGGMYPHIKMTNPNIGEEFWGKQITNSGGFITDVRLSMQDNYALNGGELGYPMQWSLDAGGSAKTQNIRIDCYNEDLFALGEETPITGLNATDLGISKPTDLTADNITQNSMRIHWVNHCPENFSLRVYKDNQQLSPALYNTDFKDVTGLSANTTYTFKVRLLKMGQYFYSDEFQFTTLP